MVHNKSQEEFEDIKGAIRSRKSKDRQHNGQKKNDKERQAILYKTPQRKLNKLSNHFTDFKPCIIKYSF